MGLNRNSNSNEDDIDLPFTIIKNSVSIPSTKHVNEFFHHDQSKTCTSLRHFREICLLFSGQVVRNHLWRIFFFMEIGLAELDDRISYTIEHTHKRMYHPENFNYLLTYFEFRTGQNKNESSKVCTGNLDNNFKSWCVFHLMKFDFSYVPISRTGRPLCHQSQITLIWSKSFQSPSVVQAGIPGGH